MANHASFVISTHIVEISGRNPLQVAQILLTVGGRNTFYFRAYGHGDQLIIFIECFYVAVKVKLVANREKQFVKLLIVVDTLVVID